MTKFFMTALLLCAFQNAMAQDEVTVPVPSADLTNSSITVTGSLGSGQRDRVCVTGFKKDQDGNPRLVTANACSQLNTPIAVMAGSYMVEFSNTRQYIDVGSRQNIVLKLSRILVPKENGTYQFYVYHDFTDMNEKLKVIKAIGLGVDVQMPCNGNCLYGLAQTYPKSDLAKLITSLQNAPDHASWQRAILSILFDKDGTVLRWADDSGNPVYGSYELDVVSDPRDGEFVSVFPGTYVLEFKNSVGASSMQKGIVVH